VPMRPVVTTDFSCRDMGFDFAHEKLGFLSRVSQSIR
jgi:hypothetical protein